MDKEEKLNQAKAALESLWDEQGECRSCGWHACIFEHKIKDEDILSAFDSKTGVLELSCQQDSDHRGVKVYLKGIK